MNRISQIYEGWKNMLIPPDDKKEIIKQMSEERMNICLKCEYHSENKKKQGYKTMRPDHHCTHCGCTLSAKTSCLSCSCPLDKWIEVVDEKDEIEFRKDIDNGE
jgi:hypothetical protein